MRDFEMSHKECLIDNYQTKLVVGKNPGIYGPFFDRPCFLTLRLSWFSFSARTLESWALLE